MKTWDLTFEGRLVRMVGTPEAPEWVAKDVCDVLGIKKHDRALAAIPANEKGTQIMSTPGGPQEMLTVKEAGLWRLVTRSRKPEARTFQTWLFGEVVPSIRKYGCYPPPSIQGNDSALVRIDRDNFALILSEGINRGLAPHFDALVSGQTELRDKLNTHVEDTREGFTRLEKRIDNIERRKPPAMHVQRLHVATVADFYKGSCPCCMQQQIVDEQQRRLAVLNFDHWASKSRNRADDTWPVCRRCNMRLESREFRMSHEHEFKAYQRKRIEKEAGGVRLLTFMDDPTSLTN